MSKVRAGQGHVLEGSLIWHTRVKNGSIGCNKKLILIELVANFFDQSGDYDRYTLSYNQYYRINQPVKQLLLMKGRHI